jgi:hypothetical protein
MKPPAARSLTSVWLIGVPSNWKSAMSLASGSLAMVSWYLIDRACFSLISALSRVADDALGLAANYLAFIKLEPIRLWIWICESTPQSAAAKPLRAGDARHGLGD